MTPAAYFDELVAPTIDEFEAAPADIRRAYAACMFAWHFADAVLVHDGSPTPKEAALNAIRNNIASFVEPKLPDPELAQLKNPFWIVAGVATLAKHLQVTRLPVKPKLEDMHTGGEAAFPGGRFFKGGRTWSRAEEVVRTRDDQGDTVDVRWCLRATRRAIEAYLTSRPEFGWPQTPAPVEEQVELRQERVRIELRPDEPAFEERTIELVERGEEAVIAKTARVVEEIVVGKEVERETETVRDTVRRQDIEVEDERVSRGLGTTGTTIETDTTVTGTTTGTDRTPLDPTTR